MRLRMIVAVAVMMLSCSPASANEPTEVTCEPATLDEAVSCLKQIMPADAQRHALASKLEVHIIASGLWLVPAIRNSFDLWDGSPLFKHMERLGFSNPFDMARAIVTSFWLDGHNCPRRLDDQKAYFEALGAWADAIDVESDATAVLPPNPDFDCTVSQGSAG